MPRGQITRLGGAPARSSTTSQRQSIRKLFTRLQPAQSVCFPTQRALSREYQKPGTRRLRRRSTPRSTAPHPRSGGCRQYTRPEIRASSIPHRTAKPSPYPGWRLRHGVWRCCSAIRPENLPGEPNRRRATRRKQEIEQPESRSGGGQHRTASYIPRTSTALHGQSWPCQLSQTGALSRTLRQRAARSLLAA